MSLYLIKSSCENGEEGVRKSLVSQVWKMFQSISYLVLVLFFCTVLNLGRTLHSRDMTAPRPLSLSVFQESFNRTLLSYADLHIKDFIANYILSLLKNGNNGVQSKDISNTSEAVFNPVRESNVLQKAFKPKCNKVESSRKKSTQNYYFNMLRYCITSARRS